MTDLENKENDNKTDFLAVEQAKQNQTCAKSGERKKTNAEKQKEYREKLKMDPEKYEKAKEKDRVRKEKRNAVLTDHEKQKIRECNRAAKQKQRLKEKSQTLSGNRKEDIVRNQKVSRSRAAEQRLRRKVTSLEDQLKKEAKRLRKWRKRCERMRNKLNSDKDDLQNNVEKIVKQGPDAIRKNLLSKEVLVNQLQERKTQMKDERNKSLYAQCLSGKIVKKYRMKKQLSGIVSTYLQRKHSVNEDLIFCRSTNEKQLLRKTMMKSVEDFLSKDENSANALSAKDNVTKKGRTMRKRFLSDSLPNLYRKYCKESVIKVSRASFYRFKPFWIQKKSLSACDTCLCKVHSNFEMLFQKLSLLKIITTNNNIEEFLSSVTCSLSNRECSYRLCENCKHLSLTSMGNNKQTFYFQWVTEKETRIGADDQNLTVMITKKKKIECTVSEMVAVFNF